MAQEIISVVAFRGTDDEITLTVGEEYRSTYWKYKVREISYEKIERPKNIYIRIDDNNEAKVSFFGDPNFFEISYK